MKNEGPRGHVKLSHLEKNRTRLLLVDTGGIQGCPQKTQSGLFAFAPPPKKTVDRCEFLQLLMTFYQYECCYKSQAWSEKLFLGVFFLGGGFKIAKFYFGLIPKIRGVG